MSKNPPYSPKALGIRLESGNDLQALRAENAALKAKVEELTRELGRYKTEHGTLLVPYDKTFGDEIECACGHPYYRHFDTHDGMLAVGCKYCDCEGLVARALRRKGEG